MRIASFEAIITSSFHSIMEHEKASSFQNILLDTIDMLINISLLCTPKALMIDNILLTITKTLPLMALT